MPEIEPDRLLADLKTLATFGRMGTGVSRVAFSDADLAARQWLAGRMEEAGLAVTVDGVGNVFGRAAGPGPALLLGSHTDTVPRGGWLDGALGVLYGLETARVLAGAGTAPGRMDVISFQDEEGTYLPCLGSLSFCGTLDQTAVDGAVDGDGRSLRQAMAGQGLDGRPPARLERGRYAAYLEAHIEQGPRLEAEGRPIGVVTAIVGIRRYRIGATGRADHAGTTPMAMRRDAGAALIRLAGGLLDDVGRLAAPETVWNIGRISFDPGAANVVPSAAELIFELRDPSPETLDTIEAAIFARVADSGRDSNLAIEATRTIDVPARHMDPGLGRHLLAAAEAHGAGHMSMPSGAGHDAMILAPHVPTAMLFIPSIGGRSHDLDENTGEADIVLGCRVFASAAAAILEDAAGR